MNVRRQFVGRARAACVWAILGSTMFLLGGCPLIPIGGGGGGGGGGEGGEPNNDEIRNKTFVGAANCALCHSGKHDEWAETLHSKALEALEGVGQGSNPACLVCHTVGFGQTDGFVDKTTTNYLANVQCENCHGAGGAHLRDPLNLAVRPVVSLSADVCGACHTDVHHPNFDQWSESRHARVTPDVAAQIVAGGTSVNNCGQCHSGEVFFRSRLNGETVADDAFVGKNPDELIPVTCAICHDPHARTGNAAAPETGRDFQLRFKEVASPTPSNVVEDTTNPERFNLCGQCHHDRGRTWDISTRGPHHSIQSNVYVGEMPMPEGQTDTPLVLSRVSVHSFAPEQCATCHMYRKDFESAEAPTISGHNFTVNTAGCATTGCHPSAEAAASAKATLQGEVKSRLDAIAARLGAPATWEYTSGGGPDAAGQTALSDQVRKARFLYYYVTNDLSLGVHNPAYVHAMLDKAEELLKEVGM